MLPIRYFSSPFLESPRRASTSPRIVDEMAKTLGSDALSLFVEAALC